MLEGTIEHLFVGEVMRHLWVKGCRDTEVLRAVTDASGYDVVIAANGVTRHIQLKTSHANARTANQKINIALAKQPSGCVVWIRYDLGTLQLGPFLFFGGRQDLPLPDLGDAVALHTKRNLQKERKERPNIRILNKGRFCKVSDISKLCDLLF